MSDESSINATEITHDGFFGYTSQPAHSEYGQPVINEVEPHLLNEQTAESVATMDTLFRSAFQEIGVPGDSGKRLLQVWAKNYGSEGMDDIEQADLKKWLEANPSVNNAAGVMIDVIAEKFNSKPQEIMKVFGLGFHEMQYFLSELAIVGNELGYTDEH